jgi:hypothetical protein
MKVKGIYAFWGLMDVFYLFCFCYFGFLQGRFPFYSDIQSFVSLSDEHGFVSVLMFLLSLILNVSIICSASVLFFGGRFVLFLVYAQTPLRLLFYTPSIFFIPWLAKIGDLTSAILLIALLLVSEMLKISSIIYRDKFGWLQLSTKHKRS